MALNINIDDGMHDGSPLGNGSVSRAYASIATCPDKECPSLGAHFKSYQACFVSCVTYNRRKEQREAGQNSGLVEVASRD